jgi:hypothetical protein
VFITSDSFPGDLGGAAGADAKCSAAAGLATLGGAWKAFLSTSSVNAIDRIDDASPWYDVGRTTLLFGSKAELGQIPRAEITEDENGVVFPSVSIWTATQGGDYDPPSCQDWSSSSGSEKGVFGEDGSSTNAILWSVGGVGTQAEEVCSGLLHLLCIEQ